MRRGTSSVRREQSWGLLVEEGAMHTHFRPPANGANSKGTMKMKTLPLEKPYIRQTSKMILETHFKFKRPGGKVVQVLTKRDPAWYDGTCFTGPMVELFAEPRPLVGAD